MKQYEAVIETLKKLGGVATLGQLNQEVLKINDCSWRTKTPFASIRRIVQERPEIYKIKPGLWALESHRHQLESNGIIVETSQNSDSEMLRELVTPIIRGCWFYLAIWRNTEPIFPLKTKTSNFLNRLYPTLIPSIAGCRNSVIRISFIELAPLMSYGFPAMASTTIV